MNITEVVSGRCVVLNCKRPAETMWTPMMAGKPDRPVCWYHWRRRLWWFKGQVFDRDE